MNEQWKQVLNKLEAQEWTCVTEFMEAHIPDYRRRLCDLQQKGYTLEGRRCTQHTHRGGVKEWKLLDKPKPQTKQVQTKWVNGELKAVEV